MNSIEYVYHRENNHAASHSINTYSHNSIDLLLSHINSNKQYITDRILLYCSNCSTISDIDIPQYPAQYNTENNNTHGGYNLYYLYSINTIICTYKQQAAHNSSNNHIRCNYYNYVIIVCDNHPNNYSSHHPHDNMVDTSMVQHNSHKQTLKSIILNHYISNTIDIGVLHHQIICNLINDFIQNIHNLHSKILQYIQDSNIDTDKQRKIDVSKYKAPSIQLCYQLYQCYITLSQMKQWLHQYNSYSDKNYENNSNNQYITSLLSICTSKLHHCNNNINVLLSLYDYNTENNSLLQSQSMHRNMNQLSSIANVLIPTTILVTIFGMNISIPFETGGPYDVTNIDPTGNQYPTLSDCLPFIILITITITCAVLSYQWTKYRKLNEWNNKKHNNNHSLDHIKPSILNRNKSDYNHISTNNTHLSTDLLPPIDVCTYQVDGSILLKLYDTALLSQYDNTVYSNKSYTSATSTLFDHCQTIVVAQSMSNITEYYNYMYNYITSLHNTVTLLDNELVSCIDIIQKLDIIEIDDTIRRTYMLHNNIIDVTQQCNNKLIITRGINNRVISYKSMDQQHNLDSVIAELDHILHNLNTMYDCISQCNKILLYSGKDECSNDSDLLYNKMRWSEAVTLILEVTKQIFLLFAVNLTVPYQKFTSNSINDLLPFMILTGTIIIYIAGSLIMLKYRKVI